MVKIILGGHYAGHWAAPHNMTEATPANDQGKGSWSIDASLNALDLLCFLALYYTL